VNVNPNYNLDAWRRLIKGPDQNFKDAKAFRKAIIMYCISLGYDFNYIHNDRKRVTIECKEARTKVQCKWRVHASTSTKNEYFSIKTANLSHICDINMEKNTHSKAKKKWIAEFVKAKL